MPVAAVSQCGKDFCLGEATPAVRLTVDGMRERDVAHVPMHCSGLPTHATFRDELSDRYLQPSVGTVLRFGT